jgi:hypothetical protein
VLELTNPSQHRIGPPPVQRKPKFELTTTGCWRYITFDEDRCRARKDFSPLNLAIVRPIDFNILKKDESKLSRRRNRLKASVNPYFRTALLTC